MREIISKEEPEGKKIGWGRKEIAEKMSIFEKLAQQGGSQRQLAEELKIPRTTLQHWLKRKDNLDADKEAVKFFESTSGLAMLHKIGIAAQFVMTKVGASGIRLVCLFLELSGLAKFIASSYSRQQRVNVAMDKEIVEFGKVERKRLAIDMKMKKISICQDETFHPEICLVGIEPVSNYILVEKYAEARDERSWNQAMAEAVLGLRVEIIQSTSDEGKGIIAHVGNGLGVYHSPDLFHIESELTKATAASLASQVRKAKSNYDKAMEQSLTRQKEKTDYIQQGGGRNVVYFEKRLEEAKDEVQVANDRVTIAQSNQQNVQKQIRAISATYHPFDLETGRSRSPQEVASLLAEHFAKINQVATAAKLSEVAHKRIEKAHKLVPQMVATIAFFFQMVVNYVQQMSLPVEIEEIVYQQLIPGFYLQLAAEKAKLAEERNQLLATAGKLLSAAETPSSPLKALAKDQLAQIESLAKECAQLFQRSSSCVEGRNGQLSLHHHSLHRLSNSKLSALTVVHNFFIKRADGSTAAERFFATRPNDLFQWLLDRIDLPARPAAKRSFLRSA
jgi:predicted transcriptional regulator/transposase